MKIHLFTYGMLTNRNIMDDSARLVGAATLEDWSFEMLTYANVFPAPGQTADGVLWEINTEILRDCDYREGYPTTYDRIMVEVQCQHQLYPAWVYTLTDQGRRSYARHTASSGYYQAVAEGYQQHGIGIDQLINASRRVEAF